MFDKKVVAITGAGSGIGRALALALAVRGARLALSDINTAALDETLSLLPAGTDARGYQVDSSKREQMFQYADSVHADFGAIHFIVNNAGTSVLATVENVTLEEIEKVLAVNLWGVIYGTKAFLPYMLAQKDGCIVNVSSVFGLVATPCSVAYTMSKFAVRGLTETLWQELDGSGVRAVVVHPGGINTNITGVPSAAHEGAMEIKVADANKRMMITPPDECARQIVEGLLRGDRRLLVGNGAKQIFTLARIFPDRAGDMIRRKMGL